MNECINLKFYRKRCNTCNYYGIDSKTTFCKHPTKGRTLTVGSPGYTDFARYCSEWKKKEEK